jgi:hypothetical protein
LGDKVSIHRPSTENATLPGSREKIPRKCHQTKKLTDRPALIQLAQLCDILADGIEAQLRADADQCPH